MIRWPKAFLIIIAINKNNEILNYLENPKRKLRKKNPNNKHIKWKKLNYKKLAVMFFLIKNENYIC